MPTTYDLFLAHASPDKPWARRLRDALDPLRCALDEATLTSGERWPAGLAAAQAASRATALLLSPRWVDAWYLCEEIQRAIDLHRREGHRLFVVHLEGLPRRSQDVPYGVYQLHGLDGRALGVSGVANALRAELAHTPTAAPSFPAPPPSSPQTLLKACRMLSRIALEEIAEFELDAPLTSFRDATQDALSIDLIRWARATGADLATPLRRRAPAAFE